VRLSEALKKKEEGNNYWKEGQLEKAIDCYSQALRLVPEVPAVQ
jgi:tetratricopeptide (TPR) repeat protein